MKRRYHSNGSDPLAAITLDSGDVQLLWLDLPSLASGAIIKMSEDPTFATGVTSASLAPHITSWTATGLSPGTLYYFELLPSSGSTVIAAASAATDSLPVDGSTPPAAPVIIQQATSTQISPTSYNLQMEATSADPLSYSWQLVSASGGPAPTYENDDSTEDSVVMDVSAPGTYVFLGTATDQSNSLSVPSDVTVTVSQTATTIKVSPGVTQLAPGASLQFTASELDQFGQPMNSPSAFSWSLSDTTLGSITGNGNFTASNMLCMLRLTKRQPAIRLAQ